MLLIIKKLSIINYHKTKLMNNILEQSEESDNEDLMKLDLNNELKRGELVTVADGEGQQYVVLEVIQLEDGSEQQVAVVTPDFIHEQGMHCYYDTGILS